MSLFKTIHLGQKVLHFTTPQPIVDEINKIYDKNIQKLKIENEKIITPFLWKHLNLNEKIN